ncbi:Ribonuclease HI [Thermogutta terrifontis]|uniref:Ribonuclease HI n=1 Tax=Thermogutta terrifontis TaxID=1331910 RepID=A0A286RIG7_9BACT|nr:RNase H family protein [Thermogutta terrifontis]ASV75758.1 Ribonuclease HI [Thermogutta terrifontis]
MALHVDRAQDVAAGRDDDLSVPRLTFTLLYQTGINGNPFRWRFILRSEEGHDEFIAEDEEPGVCGERLELLTIARALESLNQSAKVIIWTHSPAVREGLLFGLHEWPQSGWHWDYYDQRVPVRNRDLWQRIARATRFHEIECRVWRIDPPHWREGDCVSDGVTVSAARSARREGPGEHHPVMKSSLIGQRLRWLVGWIRPSSWRARMASSLKASW